MATPQIRVVFIEDSSLMRLIISDLLRSDPAIDLVDTAQNGKEGLEKVKQHRPDVVITDLVMPDYDGLYVVQRIMQEVPTPVVVLSALEKANPRVFDALQEGAVEFVDKPKNRVISHLREVDQPLLRAVKLAAAADISKLACQKRRQNTFAHTFAAELPYEIVCLGASTGGPGAIESILTRLPENLVIPVVIAQHMPERFLETFAQRLNNLIPLRVKLAEKGETPTGGTVYLAPGHSNTTLVREPLGGRALFKFTDRAFREFNHPSVDCLMLSVAKTYGARAIGVLMTGMGRDGTEGMAAIYAGGGYTLVQDEASSVVYGMGRSALETGVVRRSVSLADIPGFLIGCLS
ncbi:MAG: chemotaxis-specific protein-glutamate methyltransferase CheB [Ferruginibacter sp.]|nr:chemotaxis-specific protein-glutamate methyltransferase CheB [Cytophagales bacterium]